MNHQNEKVSFDYYYGKEAEQFSFYRLPKILVTDKRFSGISSDAKILYGLMLDRMQLSMKCGWLDRENRVFIIYTVESIMRDLGCARDKAMKLTAELDDNKGIGLIKKVRQGQGKPARIYVMNFLGSSDSISEDKEYTDNDLKKDELVNFKNLGDANFKKSMNTDVKMSVLHDHKKSENTDRKKSTKAYPNKTDKKYTDSSDTQSINLSELVEEDIPKAKGEVCSEGWIDRMNSTKERFRKQIGYDTLVSSFHKHEQEQIDDLVALMAETYLFSGPILRINKQEVPKEIVLAAFEKIRLGHIEFVLESLKKNTKPLTNPKNFLLTTLYNSAFTKAAYTQAEVNHDLYGEGGMFYRPKKSAKPNYNEFLQGSLAKDLDEIERLAMMDIKRG